MTSLVDFDNLLLHKDGYIKKIIKRIIRKEFNVTHCYILNKYYE